MSDSNTIRLDPNAPDDPGDSMQGREDEGFIALPGDLNQPGQPYDPDLDPNATEHSTDWPLKVLAVALGTTVEALKAQGVQVKDPS